MKEPLSQWRFRWAVRPRDADEHRALGRLGGIAFRACREACGLSRREVAAGWGISLAKVRSLEAGRYAFVTVSDLQAAISQLWCWRSEQGTRG